MATIYDYTNDQAFARELVELYGRLVKFQLTAGATDPNAPWKNAAPAVSTSYDLPAVFVPPSSSTQLGLRGVSDDMLKRFEQIAIVATGANFAADLSNYDSILDDGQVWHVLWSETFKPGGKILLYFFGVKR